MDNIPQLGTAADLELRAARIADPGIDLKTKHTVACELREMIDTVRDADSARVFPQMIPLLLAILRSGDASFQKDTLEFQFRRVLLEVLHRVPYSDVIRPQALSLLSGMLHILHHDNEENGVTSCKIIIDLLRSFRALTEELVAEFMSILQEVFRNIKGLVEETLSEESPVLDPNVVMPSTRSFKVLAEMGMVVVTFSQSHRPMVVTLIQTTLGLNFEVLALESSAQRKAREDYEAMGSYWAGMAPTIKNPSAYADFVNAQIKMVSYVAYVIRGFGEQFESFGERLILSALRLLQDLPANSIQARKDLMVVLRHLIGTPHRKALLPHIDKLFDEQVLLGTGVGSRETIRPAAYASLADLVHHLRGELSAEQLAKVAKLYSMLLHNPYLGHNLHTLFSKMMFGLIENITAKATPQAAACILGAMFETCVDRVEAMTNILEMTTEHVENAKRGEESQTLPLLIERARPVAGAAYAIEKPEEVIQECRYLFRTLLHGFRVCLAGLKKCDGAIPDGTLIFRLFASCVKCMVLVDAEPREATEIMDWFSAVLLEVNLHVFQEVWTHKIETFVQASVKRATLLHICQTLFSREAVSPTLVAIVLRFLIDRLPQLGEYEDPRAVVSIRLFKMAFSAVTAFPISNEPILASHLAKLIMDCFPLAAKATKPTNYYHLLRGLFRAIGGGGGRFELLYKEVLPLLPEMLESLNRQLFASDGISREMIVELCLTVPLRLTHLLPHLSYLMHPLALALRGSPELASQGLRTLELCIDNLTPDFLDPTLNTVLRELMEALHSHLKPLPANHHHAHTTIRVLGKLGGRNRRLLSKEPLLEYNSVARPASIILSFGGTNEPVDLGAMSSFAALTLLKTPPPNPYCGYAYTFLETCINSLLHEHNFNEAQATVFVRCFEAILDAIHIPEYSQDAQKFTRELSKVIFAMEIRKNATKEAGLKRYPTPLLSSYLEAIPHALARESLEDARRGQEVFIFVMQDLVAMIKEQAVNPQDVVPTLHQLANRFSAMCLEDSWVHKSAGCNGIRILTGTLDLGVKWVSDREVDFIRTLLHILKDLPHDLHRDVGEVTDVLKQVLRVGDVGPLGDTPVTSRPKLLHLIGILFAELSSPNPVVRQAVQGCIELLVELTGKSAYELLLSHRDRMLTAIYTKPLRALSFPIQIGMIDAVRYCISLHPPLPELNDELLRLLHETLALADADDLNLGRGNLRQNGLEVIKLRVSCIKLLTASMPVTDFFTKQIQTRQRVTGVYFKSLYSPSQEVKEVAHEGLRMVLAHQSRLPKELLQTGLRPVLMNLADPKRLSVSGLEGLARLLELLINYFKVEIGHKLLDHFRIVADPQMLQASSRLPLPENEGITKLVQLANIFHLLPSTAHIFLENLVNAIVQTEAQMHFSDRSPFSEPLGKYLDRYPGEALDFFLKHLHFPRHVRTLRSILRARLAPNLERELASRTQSLVELCLKSNDKSLLIPGLSLFDEIADIQPSWTLENLHVVDVLVEVWRSERLELAQMDTMSSDVIHRHSLLLSIFKKTLQRTSQVDILFEVVDIYTRNLAMDLTRLTQFLYDHVALNRDLFYRRNVLARFLVWFEDSSASWAAKTYFLRFIVTPTIIVQANNSSKDGLLDSEFISAVHQTIWQPMIDDTTFTSADDMFKIELLHLTTVLVHRFPELLEDVKRDIIRCAWHYITSDDAVVKQTAYLLAARFFDAFDTPQKFILRAWTGLLRPPHTEGKALIKQALDILAPALPKSGANDVGYPQWAKTTRRLLAEEGNGFQQIIMIYQLLVRQPHLFYPVRALFIPHMVNSLTKLGLSGTASTESRALSIDICQVIFDWEQKPMDTESQPTTSRLPTWTTPLAFRETIVSFLVRLATAPAPLDPQSKNSLVSRALALLWQMVSPAGWSDVTVKLNYFSRALEQLELDSESHLNQALSTAKVLQVVTSDKDDAWFVANSTILQSLVRKGLMTDEPDLHDTLYPIFDRLLRLFPLPDRDEKQGEMSDFHNFVYTAIEDGLSSTSAIRGILLMLNSVVRVAAERIQPFSASLLRLLSRLAKDHVNSAPNANGFDNVVRLITSIIDTCKATIPHLGEHRKAFLGAFTALTEKSKSVSLCRHMLDVMREWVLGRNNTYPTMKDKLNILQKMTGFESRGEQLFHDYLELVYDIYVEPSLRRSDLTSRLEQCFLLGCRAKDTSLRERFMDLLDASIPRSPSSRLAYILGVQSWEPLADHNWIFLALHLLLGSVDVEAPLIPERKLAFDPLAGYLSARQKAASIVRPMQRLTFLDPHSAHDVWVSVFSVAWKSLSRREQADMTLHMINLLSKDYHLKQAELRPNVIQTLLSGVRACNPPMTLPPHLVKYLAKTYGAWHVSLELLEQSVDHVRDDDSGVRDAVYDSLAEVYAELGEEDMFYGLWRRRCLHLETNIGVAFEQNGMWEQASHTYEMAQTKAKHGTIAFSETEYCLWEDHWMLSAEKLQQWDTLYELAKSEGNIELMLESAWRIKDWTEQRETLEDQINQLPDVATPRRRVFEAFIALLKLPGALDKNTEFTKILEDAMQLSLRKWVGLPPHLSVAHVPLLQHFQQFVELQEAVQIFGSLSTTNAQNLEKKSSDLKMVLQAWRERLPNLQDDISIWSDLVAWRQNVFNAINKAYIPLISNNNQSSNTSTTNFNTAGYRGYHETAWIINRFAHVARKHDLLDVCFSSLNKIYTLPNIEISEAFLKLREQARCHYQKPSDLVAGLEVINNTNLMYFSNPQKAEFFTLKGMFHARGGRNDDANHAFAQAVQMDMMQAKAWAEWGRYNDRMFKEHPTEMSHAANAVSCYLQAAGQYKNRKSRPLLTRVLWLLSVDDTNFTISRAFDTYKGEAAFWYWISLIPQLCLSINQREAKQARYILLNLAKLFPQALFFPLRTTKEDMVFVKKQAAVAAAAARAFNANHNVAVNGAKRGDGDQVMQDANGEVGSEITKRDTGVADASGSQQSSQSSQGDTTSANLPTSQMALHTPTEGQPTFAIRHAWEHVEEVVQILKTAFPLLILTMETTVDQILQRFKATPEEEIYRLICMLLQDAIQNYVMRTNAPDDDGQLAPHTISNITKMATNLAGPMRKEYEDDFLKSKPTHYEYIRRLQRWRDRQEKHLDSRPRFQSLDLLSHYLTEFQYSKFDDIEVPGQYTEDKDSNQNFIHIQRFGPKFENCRSHGYCWKRFTVHGNDHSRTSFSVQLPSGRHCRREERVMQVFRMFNGALSRKKEARKRNLNFHIPAAVSCSPSLRLLQNDSSYVTLGDIYDRHCEEHGITREDPILVSGEKVKRVLLDFKQSTGRVPNKTEYFTLRKDIMDEVVAKLVPDDILTKYMTCVMEGPSDLWRMRKQFALQVAATSFMTYVFCLTSRSPSRFHISRSTGLIAMSELLPGVASQAPVFASNDAVPFRLTPNMQRFIGPILTEGLLTTSILAIARCLTEPDFCLDQQLCLFARDEVMTWLHGRGQPWTFDLSFRTNVAANIEGVVKRAEVMACKVERDHATATNSSNPGPTPVVQTVTNLISTATNPMQLMRMTEIYHPWF
ncbi:hypothetical protein F5J12DRAFT_25544 [Pisolithus orientalis]|uniref:uncharacterized protein n=1 Tax=Pisolithus orientalis TaxID=936130 RepID=UPI0022241EEB|nr:uncharacterized protein F5J12DRAFT_25544 [Pisolithus orientalis]KAI6035416.1 hypothetical protein F5J12DRAFT_25544 [Pisolithus orientalis]